MQAEKCKLLEFMVGKKTSNRQKKKICQMICYNYLSVLLLNQGGQHGCGCVDAALCGLWWG